MMSDEVSKMWGEPTVIQRDTLPMQVLNKLMDWIMDGTLNMGDKLNTEEIARQLGVSRMPIREALTKLEKMGLAQSVPYVGVKLISLKTEDIVQIYIMRKALEPIIAEKACRNISDEDIAEIEKIHLEYIDIVSQNEIDAKMLYLQNRKFHFAIYKLSNQDKICSIVESLWDNLSFFKLIYGADILNNESSTSKMIQEHAGFIEALKQRDHVTIKKKLSQSIERRLKDISQKQAGD